MKIILKGMDKKEWTKRNGQKGMDKKEWTKRNK